MYRIWLLMSSSRDPSFRTHSAVWSAAFLLKITLLLYLFYSLILVHLFSVSYIDVFKSRVHAISSGLTNTTNMCPNNFIFAPNYGTRVRSIIASCYPGRNNACIWNDVLACVAAARALLCLKSFKWLARIACAWKTSVLTFYLFSVWIRLKCGVLSRTSFSNITYHSTAPDAFLE